MTNESTPRAVASTIAASSLSWWQPSVEASVTPIQAPALASWDAAGSPSQRRLAAFLEEAVGAADVVRGLAGPAYLRLDVVKPRSHDLLVGHDVENYLTPLVHNLAKRGATFALVVGTKRHAVRDGELSTLSVGQAVAAPAQDAVAMRVTGSSAKSSWKEAVHRRLRDQGVTRVAGPLEVHLALRCGPRRSWWNLWKPAGDALGPLLGEHRPYHPEDDRILELHLHRSVAPALGHDVELGVSWRSR